ncbi:MAG TPA: tRNA (adenosine(37)-N6)-threonylcarbamoyltransferase complex ATPase subunit type 1 TsaE [Chloroflexota bacterium]|nr:tRNA (adenosine(37)-N6)-threonylcarbamoyltransferase complex ATPase subunit type 1 TsaE [Chloroflexota bacterium]
MVNPNRRIRTEGVEETLALGQDIGSSATPRSIVVINGDLGAGKTVLAHGIARGLGVATWRGSPTFAIVHEYRGRLPLFHLDAYRLEPGEVEELDLDRMLDAQGVVAVEWGDKVLPALAARSPSRLVRIGIVDEGDDLRSIEIAE